MRLTQFEYLVALKQCGSFSKASEILYVSQPAISKAIRELEGELNCNILVRTNHGISFTPFGESILDACNIILNEISHIRNTAKNSHFMQSKLCIAGPAHFAAPALVPLVMELNSRKNSSLCDMSIGNGPMLISQMQAHALDFALIYSDSISHLEYESALQKGYIFKPLLTEPMVISCRHDHPLSGHPISSHDILNCSFLSMYDLPDSRVEDLLKENKKAKKIIKVLDRLSARQIACSSDTLIPVALTALQSDNTYLSNKLDFLDVKDIQWDLNLCLVYHRSSPEELPRYIADIAVKQIKALMSMPNCFGQKPLNITYK